ncbi:MULTISPECIES: beta-ketoacyl-ACP synthase [Rhodopseudomonas]|uniref:3-oxoacyl-ACP synthase n=1 Tax=Rhodopseudomonas palustris TaxID=1076 RepID=A0A0D7F014_RHOPL|nr:MULTISPECIES: beta-ketoacyl-ACP synthase [Rhodopseudomonas]KIZ46428.1 3-oxoacyl-ACP synthase [Rhodopseudomonas palustris]MDF3810159.1 beta-ketoacyl-ACP synthase [Rhodopseudomonas sp. BAL398]WOK19791.1 beta-ketoacyl-ACP synthase [Rhodopseudomonas sp. BAL398]
MADMDNTRAEPVEAWITGIGLASSLADGLGAHWDALAQRRINVDSTSFAPYIVHPLAPVSFDTQIPKKGDQRQMEAWQRIGTYAAGLALDSAGIKGNSAILSKMDMIVAAGGGERDLAVDSAILSSDAQGSSPPGFLNERLMNDLRPTLFLAQLSNLLAGNIAIVHGVTGSSRTFMGEEAAGVDAVRIALARIAAGQSDIALVGAALNGERKDQLMLYEFGDFNLKDTFQPVWAREPKGGFTLGSAGAFLVIESKPHAQARGAKPYARLTNVVSDLTRRAHPGEVTASMETLWSKLGAVQSDAAIISGATGTEPATAEERAFLRQHPDHPVRAFATAFGHTIEAQFPLGIALAALALSHGALFPPNDPTGAEIEMTAAPTQIVVTGTGHWRGEGMALVEAVS